MKKSIGFLSLLTVCALFSCSNNEPAAKEVIVVPSTTPVIVTPPVVVTQPAEKNTSVTVDKNGVKVESKKVNVILNKH